MDEDNTEEDVQSSVTENSRKGKITIDAIVTLCKSQSGVVVNLQL